MDTDCVIYIMPGRSGCLTIQSNWGLELDGSELREMASDHHNGTRFTNRGELEVGSWHFVNSY